MRSRRHAAAELHKYHTLLVKTTLKHQVCICHLDTYVKHCHVKLILEAQYFQDPNTGLFPGAPGSNHAWIRDNVYITVSVWALSMAYKKCADYDEDKAKVTVVTTLFFIYEYPHIQFKGTIK